MFSHFRLCIANFGEIRAWRCFGNFGCENIAKLEFPKIRRLQKSLCSQARLWRGCVDRKQAESVFVDVFMQTQNTRLPLHPF